MKWFNEKRYPCGQLGDGWVARLPGGVSISMASCGAWTNHTSRHINPITVLDSEDGREGVFLWIISGSINVLEGLANAPFQKMAKPPGYRGSTCRLVHRWPFPSCTECTNEATKRFMGRPSVSTKQSTTRKVGTSSWGGKSAQNCPCTATLTCFGSPG